MRSPTQTKWPDTSYGLPGAGVDAGQRPLVVQQQRLVRGVELDRAHRVEVGAAGGHEPHRLVDVLGDPVVAGVGRVGDEAAVPVVHVAQVGEPALGERAHEVQRRRAGVVGPDQALRVGRARLGGEGEVVDHVAAVGRQGHALTGLVVAAARLGVLAGHPADLDDRRARAVGQHGRHLQDGLDPVADVVGGRGDERLGAVTPLQDESLAARGLGQAAPQDVALASEHQRRIGRQRPHGVVQGARVRPRGLLGGRKVTPGVEAGEDVGGCVDTHPSRVVASLTATAPGPHPETRRPAADGARSVGGRGGAHAGPVAPARASRTWVTAGEVTTSVQTSSRGVSGRPSRSRSPPPSRIGHDRQVQLVDQAGAQVLLDGGDAATEPDVLAAGGRACLLERRLDAVGDEVERRAALHRQRVARVVGERRTPGGGRAGRRPTSPSSSPSPHVAADRPEHVAAHDRGADAGVAGLGEDRCRRPPRRRPAPSMRAPVRVANTHSCSRSPPTPSGFSRLWSGPAA